MESKDTTILSFSQIFLVVFLNKKMFYFFAFFSCVCRKIFVILQYQFDDYHIRVISWGTIKNILFNYG